MCLVGYGLLLATLGSAAVFLGPGSARADTEQHVWVHYDYMVAADGTSYAPDPRGIDLVVQAFAAHGIDLHVDPQHTAIPNPDNEVVAFDVGTPNYPGQEGCSQPFVKFSTLKSEYFHPISNHEWHYAVFAPGICGGYGGFAQLPGDDFVVAMLPVSQLIGGVAPFWDGGTFMHELGHNLGLHHGGDVDANWKPNYISVMNYFFQVGIPYANTPGSTDIASYRLDYSEQALPTLDENNLDERQGIGATGSTDISYYLNSLDDYVPVPVSGPTDWNHDGVIEPDVRVDLDPPPGCGSPCGYEQMTGFNDWPAVHAYLAGQPPPGPRTVAIEPPDDQPLVTGVSPATGPSSGGTAVTITGIHLKNVDAVNFGPCPTSTFTVVNEHTITALSPACDNIFDVGPTAAINVTVSAGSSLSPPSPGDLFTYALTLTQ
jgi:hypothetical protein